MLFSVSDIIKFIVTVISFIDFIIFMGFFLGFMVIIPFKSKDISTKMISIFVIFIFIIYKAMHIPMFLSTVSLFQYILPFGNIYISILTYINVALIVIPLLVAIYISFIRRNSTRKDISEYKQNSVKIIMPIYNEDPQSLYNAIISITKLNYNKNIIHLYLSFDDDNEPDAFIFIMKKFGLINSNGEYLVNNSNKITIDIYGVYISICRFKHGGKKSAQFGSFKEVEKDYHLNLDNSLIFFIDSDIVLQSDSLLEFNYHMIKHNKNCLTGIISCIASDKPNFLTFYQDIEYISGQILWRNFESILGTVTCLPGAFTIMKYTSLKKVSDIYFQQIEFKGLTDYHRFYLGEDRYLTHLLMESEPHKIGFCESARCKTHAPKKFSELIKQRRRWALGHIANDTWMLSSYKLWKNYILLSIFNVINNSRHSSVYIYLVYFVFLLNNEINIYLRLGFIVLPILLNWIFISIYALKLRRKMNIIFYLITLIVQPIFSMIFIYYSILTMKRKGWGGVRNDAKHDIENQINNITEEIDIDDKVKNLINFKFYFEE